jgi:hypothetical protein
LILHLPQGAKWDILLPIKTQECQDDMKPAAKPIEPSSRLQALLAGLRRKLRFLYGSYRLVLVWPIAALLLGAGGWYRVLSDLHDDREEIESHALRQAEVLSRSYGDQLLRAVEAIDQIALQVRYHWDLSAGKLQLNDAKAKVAFPPGSAFSIAIFDQDGALATGTLPTPPESLLTKNEFFAVHRTATEDFLYIGQPVLGRIAKKSSFRFRAACKTRMAALAGRSWFLWRHPTLPSAITRPLTANSVSWGWSAPIASCGCCVPDPRCFPRKAIS